MNNRNHYEGYRAFISFCNEVQAGTAQEGAMIELNYARREDFRYESDWIYEGNDVHKSMRPIGMLIESGKLPENTTIKLFVSNHEKTYFNDFIIKALKSGKCPAHFTLDISIASFQNVTKMPQNKNFEDNWIRPLIEVMKSGLCPIDFKIKMNYGLRGALKYEFNMAIETYKNLCAQQAVLPLVQAQRQGTFLPDTALSLICYFMCYPDSHQSPENYVFPVLQQYKDTLTLISAACFVEQYGGFNSSALSKAFHASLSTILDANLSKKDKANFIRMKTPLFVAAQANQNTRAVQLVTKFGLYTKPLPKKLPKIDELDRIPSAIDRYNAL